MNNQEFNIVIEKLRPKLLCFAKGFVKDGAATADDMVQEAVLKLWNTRNLYEIRNPEALTKQILKNVCIDYLRLKKNNEQLAISKSEMQLEKINTMMGLVNERASSLNKLGDIQKSLSTINSIGKAAADSRK